MNLHESVIDKLMEYGYKVFVNDTLSDNCIYISSDLAAIFVDEKNNIVKISYVANTKAEDAASFLLIIQEIEEIDEIVIMESFIFDSERKVLSGEDAYQAIQNNMVRSVVEEMKKHEIYSKMLEELDAKSLPAC